jgi:hypothetical protein
MQGAVPSSGASLPAPSATGPYNTTMSVKPTGGSPVTPTSAYSAVPSQFTGAAAKVVGGAGAILAAAAALVL